MHESTSLYNTSKAKKRRFNVHITYCIETLIKSKKIRKDKVVPTKILNLEIIHEIHSFMLQIIPYLMFEEDKDIDLNYARPADLDQFIDAMNTLLSMIKNMTVDLNDPLYPEYKKAFEPIKRLIENIICNGLADYEENAKLFLYAILTSEQHRDTNYLRSLFPDDEIENLKKRLSEKFTSKQISSENIIDIVKKKYLLVLDTYLCDMGYIHNRPISFIDAETNNIFFMNEDSELEKKIELLCTHIISEALRTFNINREIGSSFYAIPSQIIFQHKIHLCRQKISSHTSQDTSHILEDSTQTIDILRIHELCRDILNKTGEQITNSDKLYANNKDSIHAIINLMKKSQDDGDNKNYLIACKKIINLITKTINDDFKLTITNEMRLEKIGNIMHTIRAVRKDEGGLSKDNLKKYKIKYYHENYQQLRTLGTKLAKNTLLGSENDLSNMIDIIDLELKEHYYYDHVFYILNDIMYYLCHIRDGAHAFVKIAESFYQAQCQSTSVTQKNTCLTVISPVKPTLNGISRLNRKRSSSEPSSDNSKKSKDSDFVASGELLFKISLEEEAVAVNQEEQLAEVLSDLSLKTSSHELSQQPTIISTSKKPLETLPTINDLKKENSELIEETAISSSQQ